MKVLYEDNHIIIVLKEVGILSQADKSGDKDIFSMVKSYIKEKYNKSGNVYLGLVHRLDRMVGGVMVFAKTSKAASRLSNMIRKGEVEKRYLAVVNGKVDGGILKDKILKQDDGNSIISESGKEAILEYKLVDYNKKLNISLVDILLKTGRHHQIRVQFSSRGHYILGDHRYGDIDDKGDIALFAYLLKFIHPVSKKEIEVKYLLEGNEYFNIFLNK